MKNSLSNKGFTLIELMVVIGILGIIMAIAIPNYRGYLIKAKRSEARTTLLDAAARLERYYSDHNVYATVANTIPQTGSKYILSETVPSGRHAFSESGYYRIQLIETVAPYQAFTLLATPNFEDTGCGCYTLTSAGVKNIIHCNSAPNTTPPTKTAKSCW